MNLTELRADLAEQLADRFDQEGDVSRIAGTAGVPLGHVPRHPKAINSWHQLLAEASPDLVGRLLDAASVDYRKIFGSPKYAPLRLAKAATAEPVVLRVDAEWRSRALVVTVRALTAAGAPPAPTLAARERLGRSWRPLVVPTLVPDLAPGDRFGAWSAEVEVHGWRTRTVEVAATCAGMEAVTSVVVSPRRGRKAAAAITVAAALFAVAWLQQFGTLPALGGVAFLLGLPVLQTLLRRAAESFGIGERSPLLAVVQRIEYAIPFALLAAVAVIFVPPVILEQTRNAAPVEVRLSDGSPLKEGVVTSFTWAHLDLSDNEKRAKQVDLCLREACGARRRTWWSPALRVVDCMAIDWSGAHLGKTPRVPRVTSDPTTCVKVYTAEFAAADWFGSAAVDGTVTAEYAAPVPIATSDVTFRQLPPDTPLEIDTPRWKAVLRIVTRGEVRLALPWGDDGKLRIKFPNLGELECSRNASTTVAVSPVEVDAGFQGRDLKVKSTVTSTWKNGATRTAVACVPVDTSGAAVLVAATLLRDEVEVSCGDRAPERLSVVTAAQPLADDVLVLTTDAGAQYQLRRVTSDAGSWQGILCNPPGAPVGVHTAGSEGTLTASTLTLRRKPLACDVRAGSITVTTRTSRRCLNDAVPVTDRPLGRDIRSRTPCRDDAIVCCSPRADARCNDE